MSTIPDDNVDEAFDERPSKSSRKREMHALQEIGAELVALPAARLASLDLPEELRDAIMDARRFTKHEAVRRQMQYIGRLMRQVDVEPLRAALDAMKGVSKEETARHHRLERLRTEFIEDEQTVSRILDTWPAADVQHLRTLRRNALREREHGKPPRAYRELFRVLRELDGADSAGEDEQPQDEEMS